MASLWDMLMGGGQEQAQMPGMASQPQNPLQRLLDPSFALPMAAGMMGNQGNAGNFGQGFQNAAPFMMMAKKERAQTAERNKTLEYLQQSNPELAEMVANGMPINEAWDTLAKQRFGKQDSQGIINAGSGNLYDSTSGKWLSAPGGGAEGIAGLVPVWLQDETGKPVLGQMTKDGKVIRSEIDPKLTPVGPYQKAFETNRGEKEGEAVGTAAGALPGVTSMAQHVNEQVESLKNDPYLPSMLGPMDSRLPNITQDAGRVQGKLDQLQGGAFLQARQMLKGGGAITDYEGQKAEQAFARLNQAQSPEDFNAALDEFNMYVQQGLAKLQQQAGQQRMGAQPGPQQAPAGNEGWQDLGSGVRIRPIQ
jgi:hypothetical protein